MGEIVNGKRENGVAHAIALDTIHFSLPYPRLMKEKKT